MNLGRTILAKSGSAALQRATWLTWHLVSGRAQPAMSLPAADLVTAAYLLGELSSRQQQELVALCTACAPAIAFIEPGTPAGHRRVLAARKQLLADGFTVVAPCPHQLACPLDIAEDWCHFATRVQRSTIHRQTKGGELSYEDEKFSFVAAVRGLDDSLPGARIVRRPMQRKNLVSISLCDHDGIARQQLVTKNEGARYRTARKASWGDGWDTSSSPSDT